MPADLNDYFKKKRSSTMSNDDSNGEPKKESRGSGGGGGFTPPEPPEFFKDMGKKAGILYAIIILVVLAVIAKPYVIVNSGEVAIKATAGKYDPIPLDPGLHFFVPFIQEIAIVDTKVRIMNYTSTEDVGFSGRGSGIKANQAISVLDSRGLPVSIDITVQYKLKADSAPQTIATWGFAWEDKIVNPVVRDIVRNVVGGYAAEELPIRRNEIAVKIEAGIREKIDAQPGEPVNLLTVQLREIILPQKIKDQIERVQIAKQEAERTRYEVERAMQEAQKKAALAKGEAEARIIKAQGQADSIKIEADADAYANKVVSESLTDQLLDLRQIQVQGKFNDALRENTNAKIFLTPGGSTPNIWVDTKDTQKVSSAKSE